MFTNRLILYLLLFVSCDTSPVELSEMEQKFIESYHYGDTLTFHDVDDSVYQIITSNGKMLYPSYNPISSQEINRAIGEVSYKEVNDKSENYKPLVALEKGSDYVFLSINIKNVYFDKSFSNSLTKDSMDSYKIGDDLYRFDNQKAGSIFWQFDQGIVMFIDDNGKVWRLATSKEN